MSTGIGSPKVSTSDANEHIIIPGGSSGTFGLSGGIVTCPPSAVCTGFAGTAHVASAS